MGMETAAIVGGGALLGGLAGSQSKGGGTTDTNQLQNTNQTTTANTSSTTALPAWQQAMVDYGLTGAQTATQSALANPVFQGNRVAGLTAEQLNAIRGASGASGQMFGASSNMIGTGQDLMNTGAQFGQNASNLYGQYAGVDPTQQILNTAGQYANNPYATGMINAASQDTVRNLYETQLPTLARASTGSGNLNSSRAGVESAIAERGAADRLANISSQIRGQLFNTGLSQGQSQYNQNLQNSLGINSQLANAYGAGIGGVNAGAGLANNAYSLGSQAGGQLQAQDQAQINAQMQQFSEQTGMPLNILTQYMNLAGKDFGRTQTGTQTGTNTGTSATQGTSQAPTTGGGFMGGLTGALGGALGGAGLYGSLGGNMSGLFGSGLTTNGTTPSSIYDSRMGVNFTNPDNYG